MIALVWKIVVGSFWGRMVGVALIAWGALAANNAWQRSKGRAQERTAIVESTNKEAEKRNAQARRIRNSRPESGAAKRLRQQYGPGAY